jgi:hypothetical protein
MEMETIKSRAGDVGRKEKKSGNGVIIKWITVCHTQVYVGRYMAEPVQEHISENT